MQDFLPVNKKEMKERGWEQADFVYVTGDAYVDHPSFGAAIISRLLESRGYKVGIISQPDWRKKEYTGIRRTQAGISGYSRKYGFHGQSLHCVEEAQTEGFLFPGRADGTSSGQGCYCIQQPDPSDL